MLGQVLQEYYIMLQEQHQRNLVDFCCLIRILLCLSPRQMRTSQSHQLERLRICFFCVAKILVVKSQTLELHPTDAGCAFYKTLFQHTAGMRSHHGIVMITGIGIASQQANEHSRILILRANLAFVRTKALLADSSFVFCCLA